MCSVCFHPSCGLKKSCFLEKDIVFCSIHNEMNKFEEQVDSRPEVKKDKIHENLNNNKDNNSNSLVDQTSSYTPSPSKNNLEG